MTLNYKCPGCGGMMVFDAESGKMGCPNCGTQIEIDSNFEAQVESKTESAHMPEPEYDDYHGFKCPSCGAEIVTDDNTVATFCSFCGSPTLVEDRAQNVMKPSRVIPFKLDRDQAVKNFVAWTKEGFLTPVEFRRPSVIKKLTGMYVPFWLYDYKADVTMDAQCTKTRREKDGDDEIIHTDHYIVHRRLKAKYDMVPADASEKMDDNLMDSIEPFDFGGLKDFNLGYLSGYYAEKYDYKSSDLTERVEKRVKDYSETEVRKTMSEYETVNPISTRFNLNCSKTEYVMMPVWMLNYKWKDKMHTVVINGETGKRAGDLPVSGARGAFIWGAVSAISFGLSMLVMWLT